jgi:hypothetical protein
MESRTMNDLDLRNLMNRLEVLTARLESLTAGSGDDGASGERAFPHGDGTPPVGHGTDVEAHGIGVEADEARCCEARREIGAVDVGSRETAYRQTLHETVAVLESTRTSFRSRRLKELRERIEFILRN